MILVINLCREVMHELEFVKPICNILDSVGEEYTLRRHDRVKPSETKVEKVILCGTSLKDFDYLKDSWVFNWLGDFKGDILGICAGAQILAKVFGGKTVKQKSLGKKKVVLRKSILGAPEELFVYSLRSLGVVPPKEFEIIGGSQEGIEVFVKEDESRIIAGIMFHPEVLNPEMIMSFALK